MSMTDLTMYTSIVIIIMTVLKFGLGGGGNIKVKDCDLNWAGMLLVISFKGQIWKGTVRPYLLMYYMQ